MSDRGTGSIIRVLRGERGLSGAQLARDAGISIPYLCQIEKGQRSPSESVLRRLACALAGPPDVLLVPSGFMYPVEVPDARVAPTSSLDLDAGSENGPLGWAELDDREKAAVQALVDGLRSARAQR